jgi:site-specific recombinase
MNGDVKLLEKLSKCFPKWWHQFAFYQRYMRVLVPTGIVSYLNFRHSNTVQQCLFMLFMCVSPEADNLEHLFISLLTMHVSFLLLLFWFGGYFLFCLFFGFGF